MNDNLSDLYVDYLISSSGPTTATGLSALPDGEISHDRITRKLSEKRKTSADLWRVVRPLIRQSDTNSLSKINNSPVKSCNRFYNIFILSQFI